MSRVDQITKALKRHDRELYADKVYVKRRRKDYDEEIHSTPWVHELQTHVLRKNKRFEALWLDEETRLVSTREIGDLVFALTDNWSITGQPVDWGIEVIMARIKACDLWNRGMSDIVDEIDSQDEKIEGSKRRDLHNNVESFLYDFRSAFKEATKDINVASLSDPRLKQQKTRSY